MSVTGCAPLQKATPPQSPATYYRPEKKITSKTTAIPTTNVCDPQHYNLKQLKSLLIVLLLTHRNMEKYICIGHFL